MKAVLLPGGVLCGACGSIMHVQRNNADPLVRSVRCGMPTCAESGKTYLLELDARELKDLPTPTP
jgi:hypothetical protein